MKVLLDHCVPRPYEKQLVGHDAIHTSRLGWGKLENGSLLTAAEEAGFAAMVTVDRGVRFQQNMAGRAIGVISLRVPKNDLATLSPMASLVNAHLEKLKPGEIIVIRHPDWRGA